MNVSGPGIMTMPVTSSYVALSTCSAMPSRPTNRTLPFILNSVGFAVGVFAPCVSMTSAHSSYLPFSKTTWPLSNTVRPSPKVLVPS